MLPGWGPGIMLATGGAAGPTFLDHQQDTNDAGTTTNSASVVVPANCDMVVGVVHGKNGSTWNVSTWTLNGIAYTSTGVSQVNSSDNNGFSRVAIVYWPTSSTGTGTITGSCTANKTVTYFRCTYIFLANVDSIGEADFDVQQSSVASVANDFVSLQSDPSIIIHCAAGHDNDSTALSFTNSYTTDYNILETIASSNNEVHTRVGYWSRAAGAGATLNNTVSFSDNQSVGITGAVEIF